MKAIIYAGIGLFSAATVYGLADYYSTSKKGTLDNLYKEQEEVVMVPEKKEMTKEAPAVLPGNSNELKTAAVGNGKPVVSKKLKKGKRRISIDDFSRGKITEVPEIVLPEKEEPKKAEVVPVPEVKIESIVKPIVEERIEKRKFSLDDFSRAPLRTKKIIVKRG